METVQLWVRGKILLTDPSSPVSDTHLSWPQLPVIHHDHDPGIGLPEVRNNNNHPCSESNLMA